MFPRGHYFVECPEILRAQNFQAAHTAVVGQAVLMVRFLRNRVSSFATERAVLKQLLFLNTDYPNIIMNITKTMETQNGTQGDAYKIAMAMFAFVVITACLNLHRLSPPPISTAGGRNLFLLSTWTA